MTKNCSLWKQLLEGATFNPTMLIFLAKNRMRDKYRNYCPIDDGSVGDENVKQDVQKLRRCSRRREDIRSTTWPLRHMNVEGYSATIFRKNAAQITIDGGLLDESMQIYGLLRNAVYKASHTPHCTFGGKVKVSFMHIDGDRDLPKWQGSQICFLGFDELCHFSELQFLYMLSRNRSTCNPDVDSWVAKFISWWIDQETGYPIPERSSVLRYFCRDNA